MPFEIIRNDITTMCVDAIVNPTNSGMYGTEGVDGAVHRAAGPALREECLRIAPCRIGQAKVTSAYALPCRYIIHTVGPTWKGGNEGEQEQLAACYRSALSAARAYQLESVAFPLISAGTYGYPRELALRAAIDEIGSFLLENDMMIYIVVFDRESFRISRRLHANIEQFITDAQSSREDQRQLWYHDQTDADWQEERITPEPLSSAGQRCTAPSADEEELKKYLHRMDKGFSQTLMEMIDQRGMTDSQCYHKANVSRQLFSKIRSNPSYQPSKPTVLAFAVALRLTLKETQDLLEKAGYSLSRSSKMDLIVEFFIQHQFYDVYDINAALFDYDQPLLGNVSRS